MVDRWNWNSHSTTSCGVHNRWLCREISNVFGKTKKYNTILLLGSNKKNRNVQQLESTKGNLKTVLLQHNPAIWQWSFTFWFTILIIPPQCFTCMTLVWISSSWERLLRCRQTSWYIVYCSLRESRSFITWGWASSSSSMGDQAVPPPPPSEPLKRLCCSSESNSCPVREEETRGEKLNLAQESRFKPFENWMQ